MLSVLKRNFQCLPQQLFRWKNKKINNFQMENDFIRNNDESVYDIISFIFKRLKI